MSALQRNEAAPQPLFKLRFKRKGIEAKLLGKSVRTWAKPVFLFESGSHP